MVEACGTTAPTPSRSRIGAAGVVGVLGDRGERPRTGQDRARPEQHDRQDPVADPAGMTRVGDLAERLHQGQRHPRDASRSRLTSG